MGWGNLRLHMTKVAATPIYSMVKKRFSSPEPSGRVSDSGSRGRGFDAYLRRVISLSKDTFTH